MTGAGVGPAGTRMWVRRVPALGRLEGLPWVLALSIPLLLAVVMDAPARTAGAATAPLVLLANAAFAMLGLATFGLGWFGVGAAGRSLGAILLAGISLPMAVLALCGFVAYGSMPSELRGGLEPTENWHWWLAHAALPIALACAALPSARAVAPRLAGLRIYWAAWALSMSLVGALALLPDSARVPDQPWLIPLLHVAALLVCLCLRRRRGHGPALAIAAALATLSELCAASGRLQLAAPIYIVLSLCMLLLTQQAGFQKPWTALVRTHRDLLARRVARDVALDGVPDALLAIDAARRISFINEACCGLLGVKADAVLGLDAGPLLRRAWGDAGALLLQDLEEALCSGTVLAAQECGVRSAGRDMVLSVERSVMPGHDAHGNVVTAVLLLRDVSERHELQERLGDADDYVRALLDSSLYPMLLVDVSGVVVDLNPAAAQLVRRDRRELLGHEAAQAFSEPESVHVALRDAMAGGWVRGLVQRIATGDGAPRDVLCNIAPCRNMLGEVKGAFVVMRDAGEPGTRSGVAELHAGADALATLPNRRPFRDRVEEAVFRSRRTGQTGAVLFIDLDNFKDVNDALGHAAGDELLRVMGGRLAACLRGTDVVARIGGDEFALLAENLGGPEDAQLLAERLLGTVREPVFLGGVELVVSCSVGASVFPLDMGGADTLLRNADTAMFRAKEAGKNNCQFFTYEMSRAVRRRVEISTQLRNAIRDGELSVVYQPRIAAQGDRLAGVEALLRWHNADLGQVGPQEFIPVAEESGLIVAIGEWVLREACAQAVRWREAAGREVSVAVNISARQFRDTDIVKAVVDVLAETGLPSRLLELELTESVLMRDTAKAVETLQRLSAIGVRVALDDFGTGYSSLSYLKRFPLDCLKVDRSFIADVTGDAQAEAIVRTIVALAHGLGMRVVAEGVETQEQLDMLRGLGCDEVQGYLLGRPAPPDELLRRLSQAAAEPLAAGRPAFAPLPS